MESKNNASNNQEPDIFTLHHIYFLFRRINANYDEMLLDLDNHKEK